MPKPEIFAAVVVWMVLFFLYSIYRFRFEYKEFSERPIAYPQAKSYLAGLQYLAFGFLFVLTARSSKATLLASLVLGAAAWQLLGDWWAYRRELSNRAEFYVKGGGLERRAALLFVRQQLSQRALGSRYYKVKRKKPWLAFLLTMLLGPFGFIYYRWQVTVAIFACTLLWTLLSKDPLSETIGKSGVRYGLLLGMAVLAFIDVCRTNDKLSPFRS